MTFLQKYTLYFIWVFASLAVLVSLYFSVILHLEPCHLCWYQRIALFPSAILLGIATFRGDQKIIPYVVALLFFWTSILDLSNSTSRNSWMESY